MKEVAEKEYHPVNFADLDKKVDAHVPQGCISAMDLSLKADPADWYYPDKGNNNVMVFEISTPLIIILYVDLQLF